MNLYHSKLLSEYYAPKNYGLRDGFDIEARGLNPLCGDSMIIRLRFKNNLIENVCFESEGCVISKASASLLSENIKGKKLNEVATMGLKHVLSLLGINPSLSRLKCALLPLETIQKAL